jgi:hypothetical protein
MNPRPDMTRSGRSPLAVRGLAAMNWVRLILKRGRPPKAPDLIEYDEVITALDRWRRKRGVPPVYDIRRAIEERAARPARSARRPVPAIAASEGHYDYVPADNLADDPARGYQP